MIKDSKTRHKFTCHRANSKFRNIDFHLTYDEWYDIWEQSGKWELRGKGSGTYVMSRFNDTGPYAVGNVEIKSNIDNLSEGTLGKKQTSQQIKMRADARRNVPRSEETKHLLRIANLGKKQSPETVAKRKETIAAKKGVQNV